MKTIITLVSLILISNLCSGQGRSDSWKKKIKGDIVLSSNDILKIGDIIELRKGSAKDETFKHVQLLNPLNEPVKPADSRYAYTKERIVFFKMRDSVYYAFTKFYCINIEAAVKANEIRCSSIKNLKYNPNDKVILKQGQPYNGNILNEFPKIKWGCTKADLESTFGNYLTTTERQGYKEPEYSDYQLMDVLIGNQKYNMSFVMGDSDKLNRIVLKPVVNIDRTNAQDIFDNLADAISDTYGKSLYEEDKSHAVHSFLNEWLDDNIHITESFLNSGDIQMIALGVKPIVDQLNFRQTKWGYTKEQVIQAESLELKANEDNILVYEGKLSDLDADIAYLFIDDKLVRSKYIIKSEHNNKNDYVEDYLDLKKALAQKYGTPKQDDVIWHNKLYKNDAENYGLAVSAGHLALYCSWKNQLTTITIALTGDNSNISLQVQYKSRRFQRSETRVKTEELLEDL